MKSLRLALILAVVALWTGCSEKPTKPAVEDNGELAAFPMPSDYSSLMDSMIILEETSPYAPAGASADTTSLPPGHYDHFKVEIVWGNLDNKPITSSTETDWSGALILHFIGGLFPDSLISFEPGQDSILISNGIGFTAWVSKTNGDYDGIVFDVYYNTDICYFAAPTWGIHMPLFKHEWYYYQLDGLDSVYQVDNINSVSVRARKISEPSCPKGWLAGWWVNKDRDNGYFFGHWMNFEGLPAGYVLGKFWTENVAGRRFKGIRVSPFMSLEGYLFGEWKYADENGPSTVNVQAAEGIFVGKYTDRDSTVVGSIGGRFGLPVPWASAAGPNCRRSYFKGEWAADCPTTAAQ